MANKRTLTHQQKLDKLDEIKALLGAIEQLSSNLTEESLFYGSPMVAAIMNRVETLGAEVGIIPDETFENARKQMEAISNLSREKLHELKRQERLARRKLDPDVKMKGTKCEVAGCRKPAVVVVPNESGVWDKAFCKKHAREEGIEFRGKV